MSQQDDGPMDVDHENVPKTEMDIQMNDDQNVDSPQVIDLDSNPSSQLINSESDLALECSSPCKDPSTSEVSSLMDSSIVKSDDNLDDSNNKTSDTNPNNVVKIKMSKEQREAEKKRRMEERKAAEEEKQRKKLEREKMIEEKRLEKQQKLEEKRKALEKQKKDAEDRKREKEEQRKEREEKKRLEEEEKAKKAEEKQKIIEEQQMKQKKVAEKFIGFFQKPSKTVANVIMAEENVDTNTNTNATSGTIFGTFQLQKNETLANMVPQISRDNFVLGAFDSIINDQNEQVLYLDELRGGTRQPFVHHQCSIEPEEEEIKVENCDLVKKVYKAKLLQFHENIRPAYFGTWRKKSKFVNGRRPFAKDSDRFDYEVDSDDEWEEEEKGESIHDSDSEKSVDEDNDYELDEFFVPHGHLSDDENQEEDIADVELMPDGQKKRKLLTKEKLLIEERTKKLKRLIPKAIGCLWLEEDEFVNKAKFRDFEKHRVVFISDVN